MKVGRNEPCPCGSGRKHKNCCLQKTVSSRVPLAHKVVFAVVGLAILATVVAMAVTIATHEPAEDGGRVWSEEHQHWHDEP